MIEKIIIKPRQTGRTTELIKMAAENNLYIVTTDRQRALYIGKIARELGLKIPCPITVRELPVRPYSFINEVLIDDADQVLARLVGTNIKAITMEAPHDEIEHNNTSL